VRRRVVVETEAGYAHMRSPSPPSNAAPNTFSAPSRYAPALMTDDDGSPDDLAAAWVREGLRTHGLYPVGGRILPEKVAPRLSAVKGPPKSPIS